MEVKSQVGLQGGWDDNEVCSAEGICNGVGADKGVHVLTKAKDQASELEGRKVLVLGQIVLLSASPQQTVPRGRWRSVQLRTVLDTPLLASVLVMSPLACSTDSDIHAIFCLLSLLPRGFK